MEMVCLITTAIICAVKNSGAQAIQIEQLLMIILNATMITITYSAIFTFIAFVLSDTTAATSLVLLVTFLMFLAGLHLVNKIGESEYFYAITMEGDEIVEAIKMEKNPFFLGEEKRKIYQNILYCIPSGDAMLMANKFIRTTDIEHRLDYNNTIMELYLAGETVLFTLAGMVIFNKKQLK